MISHLPLINLLVVSSYSPTNVPTTTTDIVTGLSSTTFTWKVNAPPFSQITLNVVDSAGTAIHSTNLGVQSGIDTSCVNFSTTSGPSSSSAKPTTSVNNPGTTPHQSSADQPSSSTSITSGTSIQSSIDSLSASKTSSASSVSSFSSSINNGPSSDTSPSVISSTTGSQTTALNLNRGHSSKAPTGAIVGGVIGGVVTLLGLALIFVLLRKRRERKRQEFDDKFDVDDNVIVPFHSDATEGAALETVEDGLASSGKGQPGASPVFPAVANLASNHKSRAAQRALAPAYTSDSPVPPAPKNTDSVPPPPPRGAPNPELPRREPQVMRHEDSGLRLPVDGDEIVELPPLYTPG